MKRAPDYMRRAFDEMRVLEYRRGGEWLISVMVEDGDNFESTAEAFRNDGFEARVVRFVRAPGEPPSTGVVGPAWRHPCIDAVTCLKCKAIAGDKCRSVVSGKPIRVVHRKRRDTYRASKRGFR